jgi:AcrR family transcriptional regulator
MTALTETRGRGRPRDQVAHDDILEAALTLLDEQCYSELTIEKIAARAGCGKPTIYRRWKTKADIVLEAYAARAAQTLPPVMPSGDALHDLKVMLARVFNVAKDPLNLRAVRCFVSEAQFDDAFRKRFYELFLSKRRDVFRAILQTGIESGQLRADLELDVAVDMVQGLLLFRLMFEHEPLDGVAAGAIVALLRRGAVAGEAAPA